SGTVMTQQGAAVTDYTVLAFPVDETLWRPQSRHIMTARPDQNGKYQILGLPPAEYYLAVVDPAEQGEWFEPAFLDQQRQAAARAGRGRVRARAACGSRAPRHAATASPTRARRGASARGARL